MTRALPFILALIVVPCLGEAMAGKDWLVAIPLLAILAAALWLIAPNPEPETFPNPEPGKAGVR